MSTEYITQIDIGKELTDKEIENKINNKKANDLEIHDSGRGWETIWGTRIWNTDDKRIIKIDINEMNKIFKKATKKYGNKAEIIFSLGFN